MQSGHYLLAKEMLGSDPARFILARRKKGDTWDTIARDLWVATDHRVSVAGFTVARWAKSYGKVA